MWEHAKAQGEAECVYVGRVGLSYVSVSCIDDKLFQVMGKRLNHAEVMHITPAWEAEQGPPREKLSWTNRQIMEDADKWFGRWSLQIPGLLESSHGIVHYEKNSGTWAVKLPSADAIVVRRTFAKKLENPEGLSSVEDDNPEFLATKQQKWNDIKPVHFGVYASFKQFSGVLGFFLLGIVLFIMAQFKVGRSLLLKYPQIFSFGVFLKEGPSEDDVKNATFQQWFVGKGFSDSTKQITKSTKPDKQIVTRISGPEIGYITTPICLVQCALLVLDRRSTLPKGGVLTPGAAFGTTDLIDRLEQNGVKFDVISTSQI